MNKNKLSEKQMKNLRVVKLFVISLIFVAIAAFIAIVGFNYASNRNFTETFYSVSSLKVNNKVRVLQISDLHNCTYGKDNAKLIERVEKLKPDIIIYTGDGIEAGASHDRIINLCEALADVAPSYYVYGNNEVAEVYGFPLTQDELDARFGFNNDNRDPAKLLELEDTFAAEIEKAGVRVLKNSFDTITVGVTKVDIYGALTSNPSAFWSYSGESFNNYLYTNESNLKITAIHEPLVFEEFKPESWGDFLLAGHTHGGVVKVPIIGPLYTRDGGLLPARKGCFVYGRYEVQGKPLIVTSGLENNNLFRINNEPEIVIVDINKF